MIRNAVACIMLLLISCLIAAGHDTYAAVSNGHMWVEVRKHHRWMVLELDQHPQRQKTHRMPGFYDNPLYRIYPDRFEKRKRVK